MLRADIVPLPAPDPFVLPFVLPKTAWCDWPFLMRCDPRATIRAFDSRPASCGGLVRHDNYPRHVTDGSRGTKVVYQEIAL
jgi:hypothetical protein